MAGKAIKSTVNRLSGEDLGWVAGIVEGEGAIGYHLNSNDSWAHFVVVSMTDKDVIERIHKTVGAGSFRGPYVSPSTPLGNKPMYRWQIRSRNNVVSLLVTLLPQLGERKTRQVDKTIGMCEYLNDLRKIKGI